MATPEIPRPSPAPDRFDVGIIGGGPAGLSAALWLSRYLHSVVVVDSGDPRNWETVGIHGYLGLPGIRPAELRGRGRDACRELGVHFHDGRVLRAEHGNDDTFELCIEGGGRFVVDRLLLAIGLRDVWPDIPGLAQVYGTNAHVCPDCDGFTARDKRVAVIGTGRSAVGMALDLTTWTRDIVICTNGRPADLDDPEYCATLDTLGIRVLTDRITRVGYKGTTIESLHLANGSNLAVDKIFFTLAQYPADDLGAQLGCARDGSGHIVVDERSLTSLPNVYAAGDIVPGPQLAIVAAAQGAVAALAMHKSLVPDARKLSARYAVTPSSAP